MLSHKFTLKCNIPYKAISDLKHKCSVWFHTTCGIDIHYVKATGLLMGIELSRIKPQAHTVDCFIHLFQKTIQFKGEFCLMMNGMIWCFNLWCRQWTLMPLSSTNK